MLPDIDSGAASGLTDQEAAARLRSEGANELPSAKRRGLLALAWEVIREPMLLLLVGAGAIYLVLGEFSFPYTSFSLNSSLILRALKSALSRTHSEAPVDICDDRVADAAEEAIYLATPKRKE